MVNVSGGNPYTPSSDQVSGMHSPLHAPHLPSDGVGLKNLHVGTVEILPQQFCCLGQNVRSQPAVAGTCVFVLKGSELMGPASFPAPPLILV